MDRSQPREYLLSEGVSANTIDDLESMFSLSAVVYSIHWTKDELISPTITLACPKCGATQNYNLDAVTDFFCPDDSECGYDYAEDSEELKPLIA